MSKDKRPRRVRKDKPPMKEKTAPLTVKDGMRLSLLSRRVGLGLKRVVDILSEMGYTAEISLNEIIPRELVYKVEQSVTDEMRKEYREESKYAPNFEALVKLLKSYSGEGLVYESKEFIEIEEKIKEDVKHRDEEQRAKDEEQREKEKELAKREKELAKREKKGSSFKRSGHLTDQILSYNYPPDKTPDLFSILRPETIAKIEITKTERSEVVEGIRLTPAEHKIIDCLSKLLHEKSQVYEPNESNYYTGNQEPDLATYGGGATPAPKIAVTLYDLTKEYIEDDKKVSGKHIENVATILYNLSQKDFLLRYKEESYKKGGGKTVKELEVFEKIINLPTFRVSDYNKEGIELSKTEETLIILHPIFRRQIDTNFILYPNDITQRIAIAYGSNKVSQATLKLRDYLMSSKKNKTYKPQINLDRLYYKLAEKYMKESRKKKVKGDVDKAIETMIKLGLLESYEIVAAKTTGEPKVIFTINNQFE
jgi:hypothetical protein